VSGGLPTFALSDFQGLFFTQYSAVAAIPANTNPGSTCWSLGNAAALLALNVQQQLAYVQMISRLATSISTVPGVNSPNVDSFCTPFGVLRIASTYATGAVTLTAPSVATAQIVVPVGGIVSTPSGISYAIIADTTNTNYSAILGGYPINVGNTSTTATVQCLIGGSAGNVQAGQITSIANSATSPPITGISTVNNTSAFTTGANTEADTSYAARFTTTMSTGVVGTDNALIAATLGVFPGTTLGIPGLIYSCGDGLNASGVATAAVVSMYVNYYGTGTAAPSGLIAQVQTALNAVRSGGIIATAYAPTIVPVNISATIHVPVGLNSATVLTACANAYAAYVNNLGLSPNGGSTQVDYFSVGAALLAVANVSKIDGLLIGENSITPVNSVSTGTGTTTLTDSTRAWTVNAYTGCTVTSAGSFGIIASNTATVATISAWVGGTPPVGSSYTITSTPAGTADLIATFGNQLVAGAVSFTAAQP
jgi:hypothetical protein